MFDEARRLSLFAHSARAGPIGRFARGMWAACWGWHCLRGVRDCLPAVIFGALAGKLVLERQATVGPWVRSLGLAGVFLLLVAGWRYAGVWREFGNPLVGNWDARVASPWWQEPGCHTAAYFLLSAIPDLAAVQRV